jgi:hypothetical protein
LLPLFPGKQGRIRLSPPSAELRGFNRVRLTEIPRRCMPAVFSFNEEVNTSLVKDI